MRGTRPRRRASCAKIFKPAETAALGVRSGWLLRMGVGLLAVALAGCNRGMIHGTVVDLEGEPLPGVAVEIEGTRTQALTGELGEYTVFFPPGPITLRFMKTGYTSGRLELTPRGRRVQATSVSLWRLPQDKGVYLFEDFQYLPTDWVEPEQLVTTDNRIVYGTRRQIQLAITEPEPMLIAHKMQPAYDAQFCRMHLIEVTLQEPGGEPYTREILTKDEPLPIDVAPVDPPEKLLLRLRPLEPLEPGAYAVHWGALDGYRTADPRMFLFRIAAPEGEENTALENPEEAPTPGDGAG